MHAKNRCLSCFLLAYFCLLAGFALVCFLCAQDSSVKKKENRLGIILIALFWLTKILPRYPINPLLRVYFDSIILFLFANIYENLVFHENSFLFVWVSSFWWELFLNHFYPYESFFVWKSFESFLSVRIFSFFMRTLFIFLSLYKNKLAYEYHLLKQIFCHRKQMIFCWFPTFQAHDFRLEFFSSISRYFLVKQSVFEFFKFSCNTYSFCRISFFTN